MSLAEKVIAGKVLLPASSEKTLATLAQGGVSWTDIEEKVYRTIVAVATVLWQNNHPITPAAIATEMLKSPAIAEEYGSGRLSGVFDHAIVAARAHPDEKISYFVEQLKRTQLSNISQSETDRLNAIVADDNKGMEDILGCWSQSFSKVMSFSTGESDADLGTIVDDIVSDGNRVDVLGISTGFIQLDHYTNGLGKQRLNVVFAPTGAGKTTFVTQLAFQIASLGYGRVLFVSSEMEERDLLLKMISQRSRVPIRAITNKWYLDSTADTGAVRRAAEHVKDVVSRNVKFHRMTSTSHKDVYKAVIQGIAQFCPDVVIYDYLRSDKEESYFAIGEFTTNFRQLMRNKNCCGIVTMQTRRWDSEKRAESIDHNSDMGESHRVNTDADLVLGIARRTKKEMEDKPGRGNVIIKGCKNRHGEDGWVIYGEVSPSIASFQEIVL